MPDRGQLPTRSITTKDIELINCLIYKKKKKTKKKKRKNWLGEMLALGAEVAEAALAANFEPQVAPAPSKKRKDRR